MDILGVFFYSINHYEDDVLEIDINDNEDVSNYLKNLVDEILNNPNKKQFIIRDEKTQVISIFLNAINVGLDRESSKSIANRLLAKEKDQQKLIEKLKINIKKGSLFIALFEEKDYYNGVVVKVDNGDFLDEIEKNKRSGLPYENKSFKECIIQIGKKTKEIEKIFLFDRNGKVAKYWSDDFLELNQLRNDEQLTAESFDIINHIFKKNIEKISSSDYVLLKNQLLGYFKTQLHFNIDEYFKYTFGEYNPENDSLDLEKIKNLIKDKLENTSFEIVAPAIKNKKINITKRVNEIVEININGFSEEIKEKIKAKVIDGKKIIEIEVTNEDTFNCFEWS
ncbi:hypothetical protein [Parvimonas micra]|uniref:hypothetical protein n=1 Tax=Parvimonas micra TaxID=33033 RepID=UPI00041E4688|nr:hypothetical protein [Parvimonas micra]